MNEYKPTIGVEIHLELKTDSKVFSPSKNDSSNMANENINEIDLGYPGVLPTLNQKVIDQAIKTCLCLNMNIARKMHFDRKNYFYPDLPKGYQITQNNTPIGYDGYINIDIEGKTKKIGIERLHIEEDTAKSMHYNGSTLLNYNRCGVPLVEIVSKPDMHSSEECIKYVETLKEILFYAGVSDCKMEEGSMRCDINISVSNNDTLGVRSEIKNINSLSNIKTAIEYEIQRKINLLSKNENLIQDTRRFIEEKQITEYMRDKEPDKDYRFFPEPDIPYLYLKEEDIKKVKDTLPMLPNERRKIYLEKEIPNLNIEKLILSKELSDYLNMFLDTDIDFKIASNLLLGDIQYYLNKTNKSISDTLLTKEKMIKLVKYLKEEKISSKILKLILEDYLEKDIDLDNLLKEKNLIQISDEKEIEVIIDKVLSTYKDSVEDYKKGKENAYKFLMGMIMKESNGMVNPKICNELLRQKLDN